MSLLFQHVAVLRVSPGLSSALTLAQQPPHLVLGCRDIVAAIDRCRGMLFLVVTTTDGRFWCVRRVSELVPILRGLLGLSAITTCPEPFELLKLLKSHSYATHKLVGTNTAPEPESFALTGTVPGWRMLHPYTVLWQCYDPGPCVERLRGPLFSTRRMAQLIEACRQRIRPANPLSTWSALEVDAMLAAAPALPLFLAALSSQRVHNQWRSLRVNIPPPSVWAYLLHRILLQAVAYHWSTDALAVEGIQGIRGLRVEPLPTHRILLLDKSPEEVPAPEPMVRYEDSLDGYTTSISTQTAYTPHPMDAGSVVPPLVRLDEQDPWWPMESSGEAAAAATCHTGCPAQAVYDRVSARWWLVAEFALDRFITENKATGCLLVPIETRRICRQLAFYTETEVLPPGAMVLAVISGQELARYSDMFNVSTAYNLVDQTPGVLVPNPRHLDSTRVPQKFWPLLRSHLLLHPLRSSPDSQCVKAGNRWWRASERGPSICLDPQPTLPAIQSVLGFQNRHTMSMTPPSTVLYMCTPPAMAALPADMPAWARCRLGCSTCAVGAPVAYTGDCALICRQELACVLWWHWRLLAEQLLCESDRAESLGRDWFALECWELQEALAAIPPPPPAAAPVSAPLTVHPRAQNGLSDKVTLRDNSEWSVPAVVSRTIQQLELPLEPLFGHIVYLLWLMDDPHTCVDEPSWAKVGRALRHVEPDSAQLEMIFRWWSKKYGGAKYKENKDFGARRKWETWNLNSAYSPLNAMKSLVGLAKAARPNHEAIRYKGETVAEALKTFWTETETWFFHPT